MKEYYKPEDFFTEKDSVEDIRKKLATMPKKGDPDYEPKYYNSICLIGLWFTEHGFVIGTGCAKSPFDSKTSEAQGIYNHFHIMEMI